MNSSNKKHKPIKGKWNWQLDDWPNYSYDPSKLKSLEEQFLKKSGIFLGAFKHIDDDEKTTLTIDLMSDEAINTSEIEGEILNRASLHSSIQRNFGLKADNSKTRPKENGIAEMMFDVYQNFAEPLTEAELFSWHKKLMSGDKRIENIGSYRSDDEPMQIVSGRLDEPTIHFEALPTKQIKKEMKRFIKWFNESNLPTLTKASIAHLYFETIHPFEDGNGRLGRAIVEKAIAQATGQPMLLALSQIINQKRDLYYDKLASANKTNQIDEWLEYFTNAILEAQEHTIKLVEFLIEKAKFYAKHGGELNERQAKVLARVFKEGLKGFEGGLSAESYISITATSRATATRDLADLTSKKILRKFGEGKGTRYSLVFYPYS